MWLCNVVAMFSYANILFAKLLMVTCLSPNSCLTPALVAYKPVAYKKRVYHQLLLCIKISSTYRVKLYICFDCCQAIFFK